MPCLEGLTYLRRLTGCTVTARKRRLIRAMTAGMNGEYSAGTSPMYPKAEATATIPARMLNHRVLLVYQTFALFIVSP